MASINNIDLSCLTKHYYFYYLTNNYKQNFILLIIYSLINIIITIFRLFTWFFRLTRVNCVSSPSEFHPFKYIGNLYSLQAVVEIYFVKTNIFILRTMEHQGLLCTIYEDYWYTRLIFSKVSYIWVPLY